HYTKLLGEYSTASRPTSFFFFFSSRRRHTRFSRDWSSDVCSSDLDHDGLLGADDRGQCGRGGQAPAVGDDEHVEVAAARDDLRDQVRGGEPGGTGREEDVLVLRGEVADGDRGGAGELRDGGAGSVRVGLHRRDARLVRRGVDARGGGGEVLGV